MVSLKNKKRETKSKRREGREGKLFVKSASKVKNHVFEDRGKPGHRFTA